MLKKLLIGTLLLTTSIFSNASAEQRTIEADGEYIVGEGMGEDISTAKERARVFALRNASRQAGVFVESISEVKNLMLTEDEIRTISANVLQVLGEPTFKIVPIDDKAISFKCYVVVVVDDENINEQLMKDRGDLIEATRRNRELEEERNRLQAELDELKRKYESANSEHERQEIRDQVKRNDEAFSASQYYEIGNKFLNERNNPEAIVNYSKAINLNPNYVDAYHNRGVAHERQQEFDLALEDYNRALKIDPNYAYSNIGRGNMLLKTEDFDLAMEAYNRALEFRSDYAPAFHSRGVCYERKGMFELALADYNRALEIDSDYVVSYIGQGNMYYRLGNYWSAIDSYTQVIHRNTEYVPMAYLWRGMSYKNLGENQKAIADLRKTLELEPDNEIARNNLAQLT
ncbi:MAG: tetratricopeptide repeat protein [Selenomonadaceae bacterium]|nr:tetratricopeptide repeat protein [Selenomonadaceae bacterium]